MAIGVAMGLWDQIHNTDLDLKVKHVSGAPSIMLEHVFDNSLNLIDHGLKACLTSNIFEYAMKI